jgi:hypothetical protein
MITTHAQASHEHVYDDATGEPGICPVQGCWFGRDRGEHTATAAPEGTGYLVTCPHGCSLGTSAHAASQAKAQQRIELHRLATERW